MANLKPLQDAVKLLADLASDSVKAAGDKGNSAVVLADFGSVFEDLFVLLPELSSFPNLKDLDGKDYTSLLMTLASDLTLSGKSQNVLNACLKLLGDLVTYVYPDVVALVQTAKG